MAGLIRRRLGWLAAFWLMNAAAVPTETSVDFYIETYGTLDNARDPRVAVAQHVFERVKAAADGSSRHTPRLVIIDGATDAWAIALPSGHVVLSRKALALCFEEADPELARTRLAFILGHELAHLARNDYWHHEVEQFLAQAPDTQRIAHFLDQSFEAREAELAADDRGYLYAAMAGFPVERLLSREGGKSDFFTFWMRQTQARITASHPFPEDRAALLRERLRMLQEKAAFFDMGVRLAHFHRCADAVYFLREFQQVFPGPAVLNNLGICALQLARQAMPPEQAGFYWLPFLLDVDSQVPRVRGEVIESRSAPRYLKDFPLSPQVSGRLREASEYLRQAVAAAPDYLLARINLATVQLYLGQPHEARATLVEATRLARRDWQVRMLDALALYEQSDADVDLWPAAVKRLEAFPDDPPPAWRYNLARLLELRPRSQDAGTQWNRLARIARQLPSAVQRYVCRRQTILSPPACLERPKPEETPPPPGQWPVPPGNAMPMTPTLRSRLFAGWESISFDWFRAKLYGFIHRAPQRESEVMEMDQFIQLQVTRRGLPARVEKIAAFCPRPMRRRRILKGRLLTCGHWAVLVRDGRPVEAWMVEP